MKKYLVGICGNLDNTIINGQTLRTLSIINQIKKSVGEKNVLLIDYKNWRKKPFSVLLGFIRELFYCKAVLVCPDERAINFVIPIARYLRHFFQTKVYYVVIGGWLPVFLNKHPMIKKDVLEIDGLFVQTEVLQKQLSELNVDTVQILPNFRVFEKELTHFSEPKKQDSILKTFFLSRVEEQKGVIEMIDVVKSINQDGTICTLDIYGSITDEFRKKFGELSADFPESIRYCGELDSKYIQEVIWKYDLQLFPTKYATEGFPGAILDSFYAGVPVLAAEWNSGREVVHDSEDGLLFRQFDFEDMKRKLLILIGDTELINTLKVGSKARGLEYDSSRIIKNMLEQIEVI